MRSLLDSLTALAACEHDDVSIAEDAIDRIVELQRGIDEKDARIRALESALVECGRQADQCRIWGGMGWIYRLPQAKAIARKVREVLDAKEPQR